MGQKKHLIATQLIIGHLKTFEYVFLETWRSGEFQGYYLKVADKQKKI